MELRTYTSLWTLEKKMYKFYDINLPFPVSLRQIGTLIVVAVPWSLLMTLLHVPFAPPWHLLWLAPPVGVMIYANRPIAEGKTLIEFVISQVRFLFSHKTFAALRPAPAGSVKRVLFAEAWRRF